MTDRPQSRASETLRREAEARLDTDEIVLAWLAPNLTDEFHFAQSLVVLTDRRILEAQPFDATGERRGFTSPEAPEYRWISHPLGEEHDLQTRDRHGVGTLVLTEHGTLIAQWSYTLDRVPAVQSLVVAFRRMQDGLPPDAAEDALDLLGTDEPESRPSARSLFRLLEFAHRRKGMIALGFVLTLATTAAGLIAPYLTIPLVDKVLIPYQNVAEPGGAASQATRLSPSERTQLVVWALTGLGGAAVAAWLLAWAQGLVMARVSERIAADLRVRTYGHLQSLSLDYFSAKRTGDLISRISSDTDRICVFLSDHIVDFATDALMVVGTAVILFYIDAPLALATLCPFPIIAWLIYHVRGRLTTGFQRGGRTWGEMTSILADTIPGIRVVKAFAQEKREIERFRRTNGRIIEANDRVNAVWAFFWPLVAFLNQLGLLVVWACGTWRVFESHITVGVLTAFLAYIGRFYARLEAMSRMFSTTRRAAASAQRIFDILEREPSVREAENPVPLPVVRGDIEFRGVGFRYGTRTVLQDFNLHIQPGEMIGLVGPSGAGKSTLVNLVCRFYDVSAGSILVDGTDVRDLSVSDYRRNIGVVLQDPFLFYGTVAENIAYGRPEATRQEIIAAARAAHAHEFILRLPDGYDSLVGERGQILSGGERQRISIARAILVDPRLLILDEATSSVDNETEREIQKALDNLVSGRTTIAIAHRLTTLRRADRLVVIEHGRLVETGQHDELLQRSGTYARLHRAQLALTEETAEPLPA